MYLFNQEMYPLAVSFILKVFAMKSLTDNLRKQNLCAQFPPIQPIVIVSVL